MAGLHRQKSVTKKVGSSVAAPAANPIPAGFHAIQELMEQNQPQPGAGGGADGWPFGQSLKRRKAKVQKEWEQHVARDLGVAPPTMLRRSIDEPLPPPPMPQHTQPPPQQPPQQMYQPQVQAAPPQQQQPMYEPPQQPQQQQMQAPYEPAYEQQPQYPPPPVFVPNNSGGAPGGPQELSPLQAKRAKQAEYARALNEQLARQPPKKRHSSDEQPGLPPQQSSPAPAAAPGGATSHAYKRMQELTDGFVDVDERRAKQAKQREYARALEEQAALQLAQKKQSDADGRGVGIVRTTGNHAAPAATEVYDPFGRGGAGAPLKNSAGGVVAAYGASRVDAVQQPNRTRQPVYDRDDAADYAAAAAADGDAEIARLQALIRQQQMQVQQRRTQPLAVGGGRDSSAELAAKMEAAGADSFGPSPAPPKPRFPIQDQYLAEAPNLSPSHLQRKAKQNKVARKPGAPPTPDLYGNSAAAADGGAGMGGAPKKTAYMAGVKELYGANLTAEEQRAKMERQRTYQMELNEQTRALQEKKERDKEMKRARDEREVAAAKDYNPFGRGGAGAPLRNVDGSVVTNLKQRDRIQGEQQNMQMYGGGGGGGGGSSSIIESGYGGGGSSSQAYGSGIGAGAGNAGVSRPGEAPGAAPFMSAMNDLRGGPTAEEFAQKRARQIEYLRSLDEQKKAAADKKASDIRERKQQDMEDERRAAAYNPWGKGGAGAPMRDAGGNIVANRREQKTNAEFGGASPTHGQTQMPMQMQPPQQQFVPTNPQFQSMQPPQTSQDAYGGGMTSAGGPNQLAYQHQQAMLLANLGQPVGQHPPSQPAGGQQQQMPQQMMGGQTYQPQQQQQQQMPQQFAPPPMMGGGGGGGGGGGHPPVDASGDHKFTRFQFSELPEWEKESRMRKAKQVEEHKDILRKQIEDKARAKAELEAREKAEDERDRIRVDRQVAEEARRLQMEKDAKNGVVSAPPPQVAGAPAGVMSPRDMPPAAVPPPVVRGPTAHGGPAGVQYGPGGEKLSKAALKKLEVAREDARIAAEKAAREHDELMRAPQPAPVQHQPAPAVAPIAMDARVGDPPPEQFVRHSARGDPAPQPIAADAQPPAVVKRQSNVRRPEDDDGGAGGAAAQDSAALVQEIRRFRREMLQEQESLKARLDSRLSMRASNGKQQHNRARSDSMNLGPDPYDAEEDGIRQRLKVIQRERDRYARELQKLKEAIASGAVGGGGRGGDGDESDLSSRPINPKPARNNNRDDPPRRRERERERERDLSPAYDGADALQQQRNAADDRPIGKSNRNSGGAPPRLDRPSSQQESKKPKMPKRASYGADADTGDDSLAQYTEQPKQKKPLKRVNSYGAGNGGGGGGGGGGGSSGGVDSLDALASNNQVLLHRLRAAGQSSGPSNGLSGGGAVAATYRPASASYNMRPYSSGLDALPQASVMVPLDAPTNPSIFTNTSGGGAAAAAAATRARSRSNSLKTAGAAIMGGGSSGGDYLPRATDPPAGGKRDRNDPLEQSLAGASQLVYDPNMNVSTGTTLRRGSGSKNPATAAVAFNTSTSVNSNAAAAVNVPSITEETKSELDALKTQLAAMNISLGGANVPLDRSISRLSAAGGGGAGGEKISARGPSSLSISQLSQQNGTSGGGGGAYLGLSGGLSGAPPAGAPNLDRKYSASMSVAPALESSTGATVVAVTAAAGRKSRPNSRPASGKAIAPAASAGGLAPPSNRPSSPSLSKYEEIVDSNAARLQRLKELEVAVAAGGGLTRENSISMNAAGGHASSEAIQKFLSADKNDTYGGSSGGQKPPTPKGGGNKPPTPKSKKYENEPSLVADSSLVASPDS